MKKQMDNRHLVAPGRATVGHHMPPRGADRFKKRRRVNSMLQTRNRHSEAFTVSEIEEEEGSDDEGNMFEDFEEFTPNQEIDNLLK